MPPPRVQISSLVWDGKLLEQPPPVRQRSQRFLFRCNRPIYGPTDAPIRWYVALASRIRKFQYRPHRTDLCFFSRRCPKTGAITALILAHVDDLVMTGNDEEIRAFESLLDTFVHGPLEFVTDSTPREYCGLSLFRNGGSYGISQDAFRSNVHLLQDSDFVGPHARFVTEDSVKREIKRFLGGLIWVAQTRYDLSFLVTLLSTSLHMAASDAKYMPHFLKLFPLAVKNMNSKSVTIWYHPFAPVPSILQVKPQLIAFSDAGFSNLPGSGSTESFFIAYGRPLSRDGAITCEIHPMLWGARKIRRVARSSLASEVAAICTTIDACYRFQALLHETFFGVFYLESFDVHRPSPLFAPFPPSPPSEKTSTATFYVSPNVGVKLSGSYLSSIFMVRRPRQRWIQLTFHLCSCGTSMISFSRLRPPKEALA